MENVNNDIYEIKSLKFITDLLQTINFYHFYQYNIIIINICHYTITSVISMKINNDYNNIMTNINHNKQ